MGVPNILIWFEAFCNKRNELIDKESTWIKEKRLSAINSNAYANRYLQFHDLLYPMQIATELALVKVEFLCSLVCSF